MKANEAPKKVYLHQTTGSRLLNGKYYEYKPAKIRFDDKIIEYIRTDAFIEKACEWINENITNNPNANSVLVRNGCVTLGMLVEDFKKYMKGE